jgi:hypothetical protein
MAATAKTLARAGPLFRGVEQLFDIHCDWQFNRARGQGRKIAINKIGRVSE